MYNISDTHYSICYVLCDNNGVNTVEMFPQLWSETNTLMIYISIMTTVWLYSELNMPPSMTLYWVHIPANLKTSKFVNSRLGGKGKHVYIHSNKHHQAPLLCERPHGGQRTSHVRYRLSASSSMNTTWKR